ncbi:MG2 domain-containing protein [Sulfuritalea sp.]|uniref:alpha-2-macroglobulin family protein n=1 Tax=Sulfuritalea sp. TaxID=2480090 RepID=UPI001AD2D5AA|nr:MG2 domain-containing protein [Sulfuritalea sp.]MBN8474569.1 alpha-2-macroglobulin [Sulfuritalea sp.]
MPTRAAGLLCLLLSCAGHAAWVQQFTPQELVDQQTRATASFNTDMVALGRPDAPAPFSVDCGAAKGSARWVDARTWAWQLERPLQPGERCLFAVRTNFRAVNGERIQGQNRYRFYAPGPWPRAVYPASGSSIEEDQAFIVTPAGAVKPASVEQNAWCEADGVGNRIPVRLLAAKERAEIVAATRRGGRDEIVLACSERLPAGTKMKLVWGKGIAAENGALSTKEESFVYPVREPFRATLSCEREKAGAPCSPLSDLTLEFSAPVDAALRGKIRLLTPAGERPPLDPSLKEGRRENTTTRFVFAKPFAQNAELRLELPPGIKDEAGRPLANTANFPLKFAIAALPPLAKFPGDFGIVELREGGLLPVTLRNVEASLRLAERHLVDDAAVIATMQELAAFNRRTKKLKVVREGKEEDYEDPYHSRELSYLAQAPGVTRRELPKPGGGAEFEVLGIPLAKPGYHVVEVESRLLGAALLAAGKDGPKPMYVRSAALVTNMAVHFKRGADNALVWVTALDSGKPVANAEVRVSNCKGALLWSGRTDAQGRAIAERALGETACGGASFLFASARLGDDYSFARSDWNEGIEPWRFGVNTWGESAGPRLIHTVFDRTLLRPGQTVSMKHVARERNSRGMGYADPATLPKQAVIRHDSGAEYALPLSWDAQGVALAQWKIPEAAKRGTYAVELRGGTGPRVGNSRSDAEFRVSDFRLPVFTGSVQGAGKRFVAPGSVPLALGLSFLNGGAAKAHPVQVSATLRPTWPSWPGHDGYSFNADFGDAALNAFGIDNGREREQLIVDKQALTLDQAGAGKLDVALGRKPRGPAEIYAEMSFNDPNGELQTIRGTVPLWPAAVVLGMRIRDWSSPADKGRVDLVTLDLDGKPVAGQEIEVSAKRRISHSHRRRVVGGFYAYENREEFADLGAVCSGRSDARGLLRCEPKVPGAGEIYLLAQTRDAKGNVARSGASYWAAGGGDDPWFTAGNQDRIDVVPEQRSYQAGDTARFRVHTPFREATALVSVEAGGIIETFVRPLSRFSPVIEVPVKGEWAPNVFVSVLVVRGRIEPLKWYSLFQWGWREPLAWFRDWWNPQQPTAMVDLAKPAWRLGLAELGVGTESLRLKVEVLPERKEYRPREEATVRLKVSPPAGKTLPAGTELAFAAVDQALLELRPNDSWNLLEAMSPRRAYEVATSTAQSQVLGKRHFGRKAVPPGGGGGRAPARELFDTLLSWQPRVKVGADGTAMLKLPINDSLTEFKLVGIATAGAALFGSGAATVRTRQDLQMVSGLPPLVREKDRYQALLTVRNGTARAMTVNVTARAGAQALEAKEVKLAAEGAAELAWDAQAPEGASAMTWEFEANENGDGSKTPGRDRLRVTQKIEPAVPVTVQQASFARVEGKLELPVAMPPGALPGRGGIELGLSPKLSTPPPGLRRFFEDYPFACLEQRASVAVGLKDEARWKEVVDSLPALLDGNGLARYFPGDALANSPGSATLSAYLLDISLASSMTLPAELRTRLEDGLAGFVEARFKAPLWSPAATDAQLAGKLLALEALSRAGRNPAKAAAALEVEPLRLPTSALIDWYLVVRRLTDLPQRAEKLAAAERELRNRLSYTGGRLSFTTEKSDYWWWLMVSGDSNAFRLIEAVMDEPGWREDLPKLLRGALERQVRGRWFTTTANAWAAIALDQYGRRFEKEAVAGTTRASLGAGKAEHRWTGADDAPRLALPWPAGEATLAVTHDGSGKPWASIQALAAIPAGGPRAFGYRVTRQVTPLQEREKGKVSRGDLWRITLTIDAEQDMGWVVVSDPIPAGSRILGEGDGRDSRIATLDEDRRARRLWPSFVERTFANFRAYYEVVPKGRFSIDYTLRINNAGEFALPPTRVEAMYAPDVFGEVPNAKVVVGN